MAAPLAAPEVAQALAAKGATLYSLELVPRTTRAQAMDVLSSQANISGYQAVLLAAAGAAQGVPDADHLRRHHVAGPRAS